MSHTRHAVNRENAEKPKNLCRIPDRVPEPCAQIIRKKSPAYRPEPIPPVRGELDDFRYPPFG